MNKYNGAMSWFSNKILLIITSSAIVFGGIFGGWWYWTHRGPQLDTLIREAFANAERTTAYIQHVVTETDIEDRHIKVTGEYMVDDTNKRFSSRATTTLTLPDSSTHSFNLHTVTIGEDMYTRAESYSAALNLTVPAVGEWKKFRIDAIPAEYRDVATPRPPIDNLTLFRKGGTYLTIKESRSDDSREGESLARYVFGLSSVAFTETAGPVSMIAERVGVHGDVEVWVRESDKHIRFIRLSNPPYFSETRITTSPLPAITVPSDNLF